MEDKVKKNKKKQAATIKIGEKMVTLDRETLQSDGLLTLIMSIQPEITRARIIRDVENAARGEHIVREFRKRLKAAIRAADEKKNQPTADGRYSGNMSNMFSKKEKANGFRELKCGCWEVDRADGVYKYAEDGEMIKACRAPVYVAAIVISKEVSSVPHPSYVLRFVAENGKWQTAIVDDRSQLLDSRQVKYLLNMGVQSDSAMARSLTQFFGDFLKINGADLPKVLSVSHLGYTVIKDKTYLLPYLPEDSTLEFRYENDEGYKELREAICARGDEDVWQYRDTTGNYINIKDIRKTVPEARIAIAASVASLLVAPLHVLPFVVFFYGSTETGKSTLLNVAVSVFANPVAKKGYKMSFKGSQAAIESQADYLRNYPLVIDDSANAQAKHDFVSQIYHLTNVTGRERSNIKLSKRRTKVFQGIILSSGERPIVNQQTKGGAINRVLNVHLTHDVFEAFADKYESGGAKVNRAIAYNFGFLGRWIAQKLTVEYFKNDATLQILRNRFRECSAQLVEAMSARDQKITNKQLPAAALLLLADELIQPYFGDGVRLTPEDVLSCCVTKEEISEEYRAYQYIKDIVIQRQRSFFWTYKYDGRDVESDEDHNKIVASAVNVLGRIHTEFSGKEMIEKRMLYITDTALSNLLTEAGLSSCNALVAWLKPKGLLQGDTYKRNGKVYVRNKTKQWIDPNGKDRLSVYGIQLVDKPDTTVIPF